MFNYDADANKIVSVFSKLKENTSSLNLDNLNSQFGKMSDLMIQNGMSAEQAAEKIGDVDSSVLSYCKTTKTADLTQKGFVNSLSQVPMKAKASEVALKGLAMAGNMLASIGIGLAITGGISLIGKFIDKLVVTEKEKAEALEKAKEKAEEAKEAISSLTDEMNNNADTVDKVKDKYAELSQGVDQFSGENLTLSTDDYKEFLDLSNQLAEVFPQLVKGYDDNGNAILNLSGNVNTITDSLSNLLEVQQKLAKQEILDNVGTYVESSIPEIENVKGKYDEVKEKQKEYIKYAKYINDLKNGKNITNIYKASDADENDNDILYNLLSGSGIDTSKYHTLTYDEANGVNNYYTDDTSKLTDEDKQKIYDYYNQFILETQTAMSNAESEINQMNSEFSSYIITWLQDGSYAYKNLGSEELQQAVSTMFTGLNWGEFISNAIENGDLSEDASYKEIYSYINDNLILPIQESNLKDNLSEAYKNVISINEDTTVSEAQKFVDDYMDILSQILGMKVTPDMLGLTDYSKNGDSIKKGLGFNQNASNKQDAQRNNEINGWYDTLKSNDINLLKENGIPEDVKKAGIKEWQNYLDDLQKIAKENAIEISTAIDTATAADSMKSAFEDLGTVLTDYTENGIKGMDISNLTKLNDENTFGNIDGSTASYEKFLKVMEDVNSTEQEVHDAFNQLASDYIYNSDLVDQITYDNKDLIVSELEKNNVTNATDVAEQMLVERYKAEAVAIRECTDGNLELNGVKLTAANASSLLANASVEEIAGLINEGNALGQNTVALRNFLAEKIKGINTVLTTDGDCNNLITLCKTLGTTYSYLQKYSEAKAIIQSGGKIKGGGAADTQYLMYLKNQADAEVKAALSNITTHVNSSFGGYTGGGASSSGSSGGSGSASQPTEETFDWVEVAIKRVEEAVDRFDKKLSNVYLNWSDRNNALANEINKIKNQITLEQQAYNAYINKAYSLGLSNTYMQKVFNGTMQIETITDDTLKQKIQDFQTYYEKAVQAGDATAELTQKLGDLASTKFDNLSSQYESTIGVYSSKVDDFDTKISRIQESGYFASDAYYKSQIYYKKAIQNQLIGEYKALIDEQANAVAKGYMTSSSEEYNRMRQQILDIQKEIEEGANDILAINNQIRDTNWEMFDYIEERIGKITEESNFLIDLLDNDKLYEDDGTLNDKGESVVYLHGKNYTNYLQQSKDYAKELKSINADLAKDPSNKDLIERREELLEAQQSSISNAEAEKEAVKSLVEEGINLHLDALNKLIDKYKESLDAAKDLNSYQDSITEKTENIAKLEKMIMAYQGDDSEESQSLIQKYSVELSDAKKDLKDTEWDRYISETDEILQDLYDDYSETLNAQLDDVTALFNTMIEDTNKNSATINQTILDEASSVGYGISLLNTSVADIKKAITGKTTTAAAPQYKGYKTGTKNITSKGLAWSQENDGEIIYRESDGALLMPFNVGDKVFTSDMSDTLWNLANNQSKIASNIEMSPVVYPQQRANQEVKIDNNNKITIELPNVTNYKEFQSDLKKDSKFIGFIQEITLGQAQGRNKLNKNKY